MAAKVKDIHSKWHPALDAMEERAARMFKGADYGLSRLAASTLARNIKYVIILAAHHHGGMSMVCGSAYFGIPNKSKTVIEQWLRQEWPASDLEVLEERLAEGIKFPEIKPPSPPRKRKPSQPGKDVYASRRRRVASEVRDWVRLYQRGWAIEAIRKKYSTNFKTVQDAICEAEGLMPVNHRCHVVDLVPVEEVLKQARAAVWTKYAPLRRRIEPGAPKLSSMAVPPLLIRNNQEARKASGPTGDAKQEAWRAERPTGITKKEKNHG